MKVTNKITGKEIDLNSARKTEDNKWVDTQNYIEATEVLNKGLVTFQEIVDVNNLKVSLYASVNQVLHACKQRATTQKQNIYKYIKNIMKEEQKYCEDTFKKDCKCITIEEHIETIKWIIGNTDLKNAVRGDLTEGSPNIHNSLYNLYLNCRSYATSLN